VQIIKCSAVIRVNAKVDRSFAVCFAVPRVLPSDFDIFAFDSRRVMGLLNDKGPIYTPLEVRNVQGIDAVTFDLSRSGVEGEALLAGV
jgi:hypothetical protein